MTRARALASLPKRRLNEINRAPGLSNQRMNERRSVPGEDHRTLRVRTYLSFPPLPYLAGTFIYLPIRTRVTLCPVKGLNLHFICSCGAAGNARAGQRSSARARAARTFILIKLLRSVEQPISYKLSPRCSFALACSRARARAHRGINVLADPTRCH